MSKKKKSNGKQRYTWHFYVGIFCAIGSIVMLAHNIIASLVYAVVAFFFLTTIQHRTSYVADNQASPKAEQLTHPLFSFEKSSNTNSNNKQVSSKDKYVINPQTMVIHKPSCRYAKNAYSFNTHYTNDLRAALNMGYRRCKYCKPQ